jgi:CubicO group peptidase (beta-lactamase class C family)
MQLNRNAIWRVGSEQITSPGYRRPNNYARIGKTLGVAQEESRRILAMASLLPRPLVHARSPLTEPMADPCNRAAVLRATINSRLVVAIVVVSVLSGCNGRPRPAGDTRDAVLAADVKAFAARLAAGGDFSGAVLLTRHGRALVRQGYGLADRKAGRPNTPETPFMLS